jgi:hypothetical protein
MAETAAFINYQHSDSAIVDRLAEYLRNAGVKVWLDSLELQPGERLDGRDRRGDRLRLGLHCLLLGQSGAPGYVVSI